MHYNSVRNNSKNVFIAAAAVFLAVAVCFIFFNTSARPVADTPSSSETPTVTTSATETKPTTTVPDTDWSVTVVNAESSVSTNSKRTLIYLEEYNTYIDERVYPELLELFKAAENKGIHLYINYAFRSWDQQKQLYDKTVASYVANGYSKKRAEELTRQTVMPAGKSEHHTGLAIDFTADKSYGNSVEQIQQWLRYNAYIYGFILRYPADKVKLTGISYEPWHYRYVGKEAAKLMHDNNLCLEEYEDFVKQKNRSSGISSSDLP